MNFFDTGKVLKHSREGLSGEFLWHFETNFVRRKMLFPPSLIHNFFASGKFLKHSKEMFLYESFCHCETKKGIHLLYFAAYVVSKKIYSFSRVSFLFFRPKLTTLSIQKYLTAVGLRQLGSQTVVWGIQTLSCEMFLRFIRNIFRHAKFMKL